MDNLEKTSSLELIRQARLRKMELDIELKTMTLKQKQSEKDFADGVFLPTHRVIDAIEEIFIDSKHGNLKTKLYELLDLEGNSVAQAAIRLHGNN